MTVLIVDEHPVLSEFGPGNVICGRDGLTCMPCATGMFMLRYGVDVPRLKSGAADIAKLATSMGARHRAIAKPGDDGINHGVCGKGTWCAKCAYLELGAHGIPVAYGILTFEQIDAHLRLGRPVIISGIYRRLPLVPTSDYSATEPLKGRSDTTFDDKHVIVGFNAAFKTTKTPTTHYRCGDADVGSKARPVIPPYSLLAADRVAAFFNSLKWPVTYGLVTPPAPGTPFGTAPGTPAPTTPPKPPAGVKVYPGASLTGRGKFKYRVAARLRSTPYIKDDNIIETLPAGTTFAAAQEFLAGTLVSGSKQWKGTADGKRWAHISVLTLVGGRDGTEDIR